MHDENEKRDLDELSGLIGRMLKPGPSTGLVNYCLWDITVRDVAYESGYGAHVIELGKRCSDMPLMMIVDIVKHITPKTLGNRASLHNDRAYNLIVTSSSPELPLLCLLLAEEHHTLVSLLRTGSMLNGWFDGGLWQLI